MPSYEDFGLNVEAHLLYAGSQGSDTAFAILRRRFDDETWRAAPGSWLGRLGATVQRHHLQHDPRVAQLRGDLISWLTGRGVEREAHETLGQLVFHAYGLTADEATNISRWFEEKAGAGDASLAADVLLPVYLGENEGLRKALRPLAAWLVKNGAAELRSRIRSGKDVLLLRLVKAFDQDPRMLLSLLRYIIASEGNLSGHSDFVNDPAGVLRGAVEHVLEHDDRSLVPVALANKLGGVFVGNALDSEPRIPRFRLALLRALARDSLQRQIATEAWRAAFWCHCPSAGLSFASCEAIDLAVDALAQHASSPDRRNRTHGEPEPENNRAWAGLLSSEFARVYELAEGLPNGARDRLAKCLGQTRAVTEGIGEALRRALTERPGLARSILMEGISDENVMAALMALPDASPRRHTMGEPLAVDELKPRLLRFLNHPWQEAVFGVDVARALRGATRVKLAKLQDEDKVVFADGVMKVHSPDIEEMFSKLSMDREAKLALGVVYFAHELVHVEQGIGDKAVVGALRSTGAETTLMHVDLGADHAAALAVSVAFPRWKLNWIKDLQGRSLSAFPVSPYNTAAGRARKAQRLVGLRLDYLSRATGAIPKEKLGDGYAFADFGPEGGKILVLVSGPPPTVVKTADLAPGEGALLSSAADDGLDARLAEIDQVLTEKLNAVEG